MSAFLHELYPTDLSPYSENIVGNSVAVSAAETLGATYAIACVNYCAICSEYAPWAQYSPKCFQVS